MDDRARIIVLAQESPNLFSFVKNFMCLTATSALDVETLRTLFWIGAAFHHHSDLPDTTGLDWKETVNRCLESVAPRSRTLPDQPDLHVMPDEPVLHVMPAMPEPSSSAKMATASPLEPSAKMAATSPPEPSVKRAAASPPEPSVKMAAASPPEPSARMAATTSRPVPVPRSVHRPVPLRPRLSAPWSRQPCLLHGSSLCRLRPGRLHSLLRPGRLHRLLRPGP
ncbi:hypothetical protein PO909_006565 [Leuciscus waleckii]